MLDEPRGPFFGNLIQSGLAPDFAPGTGYDSSYRYASFGVGVQGIATYEVAAIEEAIQKTLQEVYENGIE